MTRGFSLFVAAIGSMLAAACSTTAPVTPPAPPVAKSIKTPLPEIHPLIGTWRIDLKNVSCHEVYTFHSDGTTLVTSGEEVSESEFEMALLPSAAGYYKWVDKIVKDNGKPDCMGSVMTLGDVATNYLLLNASHTAFLMCQKEDIDTCIGPFVRQ